MRAMRVRAMRVRAMQLRAMQLRAMQLQLRATSDALDTAAADVRVHHLMLTAAGHAW